jgi:hypothetical protein
LNFIKKELSSQKGGDSTLSVCCWCLMYVIFMGNTNKILKNKNIGIKIVGAMFKSSKATFTLVDKNRERVMLRISRILEINFSKKRCGSLKLIKKNDGCTSGIFADEKYIGGNSVFAMGSVNKIKEINYPLIREFMKNNRIKPKDYDFLNECDKNTKTMRQLVVRWKNTTS